MQNLDIDITGEQAYWIKYKTWSYKKKKKKKNRGQSELLCGVR